MSYYDQHREFYNQPVLLSPEEMADPMVRVKTFFIDYNLTDLRVIFKNIVETCVTTDEPPFHTAGSRSDIILHCEHIMLFVEAGFLIYQNHQDNGAGNQ